MPIPVFRLRHLYRLATRFQLVPRVQDCIKFWKSKTRNLVALCNNGKLILPHHEPMADEAQAWKQSVSDDVGFFATGDSRAPGCSYSDAASLQPRTRR
jgi:hypothetical protein